MGKLIIWNLITLDGYFEGEQSWALDFHNQAWGPELERFSLEQLNAAGMLIFGRVTYEGMAAHWQTAEEQPEITAFMNELPKLVVSTTLDKPEWNNTRAIAAVDEIAAIKKETAKDLFVFGSGRLTNSLRAAGLIDEYRLCLAPLFLGKGRLLFEPGAAEKLELAEARPLGNGCVLLFYRPLG